MRWIKARTGKGHLDLGERSSNSHRVKAEHIIVTPCRAHLDANAALLLETDTNRCSNCVRIFRTMSLFDPNSD